MANQLILSIVLLNVFANGQISDYLFPKLTKSTREITAAILTNPVVDWATYTSSNVVATAVDLMTKVPYVIAGAIGTSDLPVFSSDTNIQEFMDQFVIEFDASKSNEDGMMSIEGLVTKYGHNIEKHDVVTEDGFVLSMFRIPSNGSVVFLMHGLLGSADDFVIAGPESGMAYLLANEGYDVWMGNARGNKHSRKHVKLSPSQAAFWDFTWHEIGVYDLPAMIDYTLNETDRKTLYYIGHSQGTTTFFVMASERPKYNEKISLMVALSPIAFMSKVRSPIIRILAPGTPIIHGILKSFGAYEFSPDSNLRRALKLILCGTGPIAEIMCSSSLFLTVGFDFGQLNVTNLPVILGHLPSGASAKQFVHYGQGIISKDFRKFDYGRSGNLERYGAETPPSYDLDKVVAPVSLFYSESDWMAHPDDVDNLYNRLHNAVDIHKVEYPQFNHLDFLFANDFKSLIYKRLRKLLILF